MRAASRIVVAFSLVAVAGCFGRSVTPTFYTISTVAPVPAAGDLAGPSIGVGPVQLPAYLERPQIATRNDSRLAYDEFHRWAGSLESEMLRALGSNLARELHTNRVAVYPAEPPYPLAVRVVLDVERFEGTPGEAVVLEVRWVLTPGGGGEPLASGHSTIRETVASDRYVDLVAAHGAALAALAREIAASIRSLHD